VAGGVTTTYTFDGMHNLREQSGATTRRYVHGMVIDDLLAIEDGSGVLTYVHREGLGSVVKETSSSGAVTATYLYEAFGNIELGGAQGGFRLCESRMGRNRPWLHA
jgi:hypothetical protein